MAGKIIKAYLLLLTLIFVSIIPASRLHAMVLIDIESYPLQLTQKEQSQVESIACRNKYNIDAEKIVARSHSRSSSDNAYAEVQCKSHENLKNSPVYHVVYCEKSDVSWRCNRSELAIRISTSSLSLTYFAEDVDTKIAYDIITKLISTKQYQGEPIPDIQKSICSINRFSNSGNVPAPDVFIVACENWEIFVSTWCSQKECPRIIGTRIMVSNLGESTYPVR